MAIQQEYWIKDIEDTLSQSNLFMNYATDHSMYYNGVTIHVPNAGADPTITKNNSVWPLTSSQRTDTDLTYSMNNYSTNLIHITDVEEIQVNYAKRQSVMGSHTRKIADAIGNQTCYAWAPSATTMGVTRVVRTTGALSGTALASGATGNRQCITLADILSAKNILDKDLVPAEGRVLLIPSSMMSQVLAIPDAYRACSYGSSALPKGVIGQLYGFNIIERPNVVVYGTGASPAAKSVDDAGIVSGALTTDNLAALAYHPDYVAIAKETPKVYFEGERPEYQGSTISARVLHGASKVRHSGIGVAAIVQQ